MGCSPTAEGFATNCWTMRGAGSVRFAFDSLVCRPQRHALQKTITNDEGVKQHSAEMGEKGQEQEERQQGVSFAQDSVKSRVGRENWRQMQWSEHNDGIIARGQHAPAYQRESQHQ